MKKLMISELLAVVLILGLGLYLGQTKDLNAASTLSVEEMSQIRGGWWWWEAPQGKACAYTGNCGGSLLSGCYPVSGGGSVNKVAYNTWFQYCGPQVDGKGCKSSSIICGTVENFSCPSCGGGCSMGAPEGFPQTTCS